jgi:hypothetical protein
MTVPEYCKKAIFTWHMVLSASQVKKNRDLESLKALPCSFYLAQLLQ